MLPSNPDPSGSTARHWGLHSVSCAWCGRECVKRNKTTTCSVACREALREKNRIGAAPVGHCPGCDTGDLLLSHKAYDFPVCSIECQKRVYDRAKGGRKISAPVRKVKAPALEEKNCLYCRAAFQPKNKNHRCCSSKCAQALGSKSARRRARIKELYREKIAVRDRGIGRCALCGVTASEIRRAEEFGATGPVASSTFHSDHIRPVSQDGTEDAENKRWLCWFCNRCRINMSTEYDHAIAAAGKAFWSSVTK